RLALVFVTIIAIATLAAPNEAQAQIPFEVNVTLAGGVNFSGVSEPDESDKTLDSVGLIYPGFFDVGCGVGLLIEPRVFDIVGIETGFMWETSGGSGDFNERTVTFTSSDMVIPLHVTAVFPSMVAPKIGIGGDFVVPLSSDIEQEE